ncbi:MAG: hypothetical protein ABI597_11970 [Gammaproteobacteria bacterium]
MILIESIKFSETEGLQLKFKFSDLDIEQWKKNLTENLNNYLQQLDPKITSVYFDKNVLYMHLPSKMKTPVALLQDTNLQMMIDSEGLGVQNFVKQVTDFCQNYMSQQEKKDDVEEWDDWHDMGSYEFAEDANQDDAAESKLNAVLNQLPSHKKDALNTFTRDLKSGRPDVDPYDSALAAVLHEEEQAALAKNRSKPDEFVYDDCDTIIRAFETKKADVKILFDLDARYIDLTTIKNAADDSVQTTLQVNCPLSLTLTHLDNAKEYSDARLETIIANDDSQVLLSLINEKLSAIAIPNSYSSKMYILGFSPVTVPLDFNLKLDRTVYGKFSLTITHDKDLKAYADESKSIALDNTKKALAIAIQSESVGKILEALNSFLNKKINSRELLLAGYIPGSAAKSASVLFPAFKPVDQTVSNSRVNSPGMEI